MCVKGPSFFLSGLSPFRKEQVVAAACSQQGAQLLQPPLPHAAAWLTVIHSTLSPSATTHAGADLGPDRASGPQGRHPAKHRRPRTAPPASPPPSAAWGLWPPVPEKVLMSKRTVFTPSFLVSIQVGMSEACFPALKLHLSGTCYMLFSVPISCLMLHCEIHPGCFTYQMSVHFDCCVVFHQAKTP